MKISTYDKYKWFILGASIASDEYFWRGNGIKNKHIKTELSDDRHVLRLRAEENNDLKRG
jgi:hypothetical protein